MPAKKKVDQQTQPVLGKRRSANHVQDVQLENKKSTTKVAAKIAQKQTKTAQKLETNTSKSTIQTQSQNSQNKAETQQTKSQTRQAKNDSNKKEVTQKATKEFKTPNKKEESKKQSKNTDKNDVIVDNVKKATKEVKSPNKKVESKKQSKNTDKNDVIVDDVKKTTKEVKSPNKKVESKKQSKNTVKNDVIVDDVKKKVKTNDTNDNDITIQKVLVQGNAALDPYCNMPNGVVYQSDGQTYSCTLNQSNIQQNNNKFYLVQLIKDKNQPKWILFTRWGRVGVPGQQAKQLFFDANMATQEYQKKKRSKITGGYTELQINYGEDKKEEPTKKSTKKRNASKLPNAVLRLMELIFSKDTMNLAMKEIGYDIKKMPLGKLGSDTILQAYSTLNDLMKAVNKKNNPEINRLSGKFYSLIPHDFGFQKMINFILNDKDKIQNKLDMLQSLEDMKVTTKLLEQQQNDDDDENDQNYKKLNCKLIPLDKNHEEYKLVERFINDSKSSDIIEEIFIVERPGEKERYTKKIGNDHLLYHGSRVSNFGGILSQGLRIAPPEAPHNGYVYGKGVYFANMYNTSRGYSQPSNGTRLILLCQAALGKVGEYQGWNYFEKTGKNLLDGYDSSIGFARKELPNDAFEQFDGMKVPSYSSKTGIANAYITYDVKQVQMRYLIRLKSSTVW